MLKSNKNIEITHATLPVTQWYELSKTDYIDCLFSLADRRTRIAHDNIAVEFYLKTSGYIEWNCYVCHCKINVNLKTFTGKSVFCNEHKPKLFNNIYKQDLILLKYVNSLFRVVQSKIIENSGNA